VDRRSIKLGFHHIRKGNFKPILNRLQSAFGAPSVDENKVIHSLITTGVSSGTMIDVGACNGSALNPFLLSGFSVYAFEPDSKNRALLEALFPRAAHPRLVIDARAVSDAEAENLSFFRSDKSVGISGLSAFDESHYEAQTVDATTLAKFFVQNKIKEVDYLKVDTEGFDFFVLKGMGTNIIPRAIMCEFEDKKTIPLGYNWHELCEYLRSLDYHVAVSEWLPIEDYGLTHKYNRAKKFPCKLDSDSAWGNLIAFQDEANLNRFLAKIQA
jgi:FkbM family methyltransferase